MEQKETLQPAAPNLDSRPTAKDAASRLVILKHVAVRALTAPPRDIMAQWFKEWPADARMEFTQFAEDQCKEFWQSIRDEGLWQYVSQREQRFAAATIVTMTHEDQVNASWDVESVQALMWALSLIPDLPPYDTMADHEILKTVPSHNVAGFIESAKLRPWAEIDRARGNAEFWHWRSRERQLVEEGGEFPFGKIKEALGLNSHDELIRFTARMGADRGIIPKCIDGDFPARGKAYRDLTPDEWFEVRSIAIQRHYTLNWLCGYAPGNNWDKTPTHT